MPTNATVYTVIAVQVPDLSGETREDLLLQALLEADIFSLPGATGEIAKIILRRPGAEEETFHDTMHLDTLHEERLDGAGVFDLEEALSLSLTEPVNSFTPIRRNEKQPLC